MYSKNIRRWMVPFLQRCEQKEPSSYSRLLRDYVLTKARNDLTLVLKIFELSRPNVSTVICWFIDFIVSFFLLPFYCIFVSVEGSFEAGTCQLALELVCIFFSEANISVSTVKALCGNWPSLRSMNARGTVNRVVVKRDFHCQCSRRESGTRCDESQNSHTDSKMR